MFSARESMRGIDLRRGKKKKMETCRGVPSPARKNCSEGRAKRIAFVCQISKKNQSSKNKRESDNLSEKKSRQWKKTGLKGNASAKRRIETFGERLRVEMIKKNSESGKRKVVIKANS